LRLGTTAIFALIQPDIGAARSGDKRPVLGISDYPNQGTPQASYKPRPVADCSI
jgi:hypothetical protein